jgi:hypothetical protein
MKICIFSGRSIGGTFLDWSIHFLTGQTQYFSSKQNQFIPLSQNPINPDQQNAHKHLKNHPSGADETKQYLDNCNSSGLYSLYACPVHSSKVIEKHSISPDKENFNTIKQQEIADTNKMFSVLAEQGSATVHLAGESFVPLYFLNVRDTSTFIFKPGTPESAAEKKNEFDSIFFKDSVEQWSTMGLTDQWDIRERNALNLRPMAPIHEYYITHPHLRIDCREFWHNGIDVMNRTMAYLKLNIMPDRLEQWKNVYYQWQKIHMKSMEFVYNCDHIVSAIVNNWDYAINLTFEQEVVIQHFLIYQHGLNLKTWQLEKFPNNTNQLHNLLESNTHQIPRIY